MKFEEAYKSVRVQTRSEAMAMIGDLFDGPDYAFDADASKRAGYKVWWSTEAGSLAHVADMGDGYELVDREYNIIRIYIETDEEYTRRIVAAYRDAVEKGVVDTDHGRSIVSAYNALIESGLYAEPVEQVEMPGPAMVDAEPGYIRYEQLSGQDLNAWAKNQADSLVERAHDGKSERARRTTDAEKAALYAVFMGVLHGLNDPRGRLTRAAINQMIDNAELTADILVPSMNGYLSVYGPLMRYAGLW